MQMGKWNVHVQSLIDHIKTAIDVDPWAKEMAEDLLKGQEKERLDFIGAVAKLTAENEMLKSKQQIARDGEPKEGKCKKCGICGTEGRSEQWQK